MFYLMKEGPTLGDSQSHHAMLQLLSFETPTLDWETLLEIAANWHEVFMLPF